MTPCKWFGTANAGSFLKKTEAYFLIYQFNWQKPPLKLCKHGAHLNYYLFSHHLPRWLVLAESIWSWQPPSIWSSLQRRRQIASALAGCAPQQRYISRSETLEAEWQLGVWSLLIWRSVSFAFSPYRLWVTFNLRPSIKSLRGAEDLVWHLRLRRFIWSVVRASDCHLRFLAWLDATSSSDFWHSLEASQTGTVPFEELGCLETWT